MKNCKTIRVKLLLREKQYELNNMINMKKTGGKN